jgi:hypothetical protein
MSTTLYNLESGLVYDFVMRAPGILGARYESATLIALSMRYEAASRFQGDIISRHTAALPSLPVGTPRSVQDLRFLAIKTLSGEVLVIAEEWLASAPVVASTATIQVTVYGVKPSDQKKIRDLMISAGYPSIDIKTV